MLETRECFKNGRVDANALKGFIKDIKKNTKLSDEDAAVIAASKVFFINFFDEWIHHFQNYRLSTLSPSPECGTALEPLVILLEEERLCPHRR